jgi:hypothetical protein
MVDLLAAQLIWGGISPTTHAAVVTLINGEDATSEVRQAAATLLASPEFLVH